MRNYPKLENICYLNGQWKPCLLLTAPLCGKTKTDYDKEFRNCSSACGEPFKEIVQFLSETNRLKLQVLDLGCGQGRYVLVAARHGHQVLGVDISPTGIKQMISKAELEGLDIEGEIADICKFKPSK